MGDTAKDTVKKVLRSLQKIRGIKIVRKNIKWYLLFKSNTKYGSMDVARYKGQPSFFFKLRAKLYTPSTPNIDLIQ